MSEFYTPQTPDSNLSSNSDRLKEEIANLMSDSAEESSPLELENAQPTPPEIDSDSNIEETPENAPESFAQETNWFVLARKQRQRNRELIQQVAALELALTESQEEVQAQVRQCQNAEILMNEQAEEMEAAQSQITRLFQELESSHQAAQRQQILIETLSEQLEASQERIAQLERECACVQQQYNEQTQKTLQAEATCEDLRARLRRQERQTMQFKAALDKYLEVTAYGSRDASLDANKTEKSPFAAKPKPIKPWSAPSEFLASTPSEEEQLTSNPPAAQTEVKETPSPGIPQPEVKETPSPVVSQMDVPPESLSTASSSIQEDSAEDILAELEEAVKSPQEASLNPNSDISQQEEDQPDSEEEVRSEREDIQRIIASQANWPSPLLYPLRNPKKRKSKSSIDLPRFPSR